MNREAMEKWIAALEDPANEGRQIQKEHFDDQGGVCALGLAWEVLEVKSDMALMEKLRGEDPVYDYFSTIKAETDAGKEMVDNLNDAGWSFWDIAQALRATHLKETT